MKKIFIFLFICVAFACVNNVEMGDNDGNENSLKIGDKGPAGGIVFYIEDNEAWEVSENLGKANWEEAKTMCKNYSAGGCKDWYLPNLEELNWVYENLLKIEKIEDCGWYWSSSNGVESRAWAQVFPSGQQNLAFKSIQLSVRAVRVFKIST